MSRVCGVCGFEARTAQGLGGHRRLKHELSAGRTEHKVSGPTTRGTLGESDLATNPSRGALVEARNVVNREPAQPVLSGCTGACSQRWEALSAEINDLQEFLSFVPDLFARIAAAEATQGLGQDPTGTLPQTVAILKDQLERLKAETGVLLQLPQRLEQVEAKATEQEKEISRLREIQLAQSLLLWELDRTHKKGSPMIDLVVFVSAEQIESAREILRDTLPAYIPESDLSAGLQENGVWLVP